MGGIGKGHLIREIDALDGLMGRVADASGIHFRVLNRRKGPAVRGPRAQIDRDMYKTNMLTTIEAIEGLSIHEDSAEDLLLDSSDQQVLGIVTGRGDVIQAKNIVITTGESCFVFSCHLRSNNLHTQPCAPVDHCRYILRGHDPLREQKIPSREAQARQVTLNTALPLCFGKALFIKCPQWQRGRRAAVIGPFGNAGSVEVPIGTPYYWHATSH